MEQPNVRMTKPGNPPDDSEVSQWLGKKADHYWMLVTELINRVYPDVFTPEWLYGGKKHGWSLRYKKSKSFCTLIPEKNRFALLIVFGTEERIKAETIKKDLSRNTRKAYDEATTYHDGKWLLLTIDDEKVIKDIKKLLAIKRKPKIEMV